MAIPHHTLALPLPAASLALIALAMVSRPEAQAGSHPRDAWARTQAVLGPGLELRRHDAEGLELAGHAPIGGPILDEGEAERATRAVLAALVDVLGVEEEALAVVHRARVADVHVVQLEQRVEGLPVRGSRVEARWSANGVLATFTARGLAVRAPTGGFALASTAAAEHARMAVAAADGGALWATAPVRELRWHAGELRRALRLRVFDPLRTEAEWQVTIDGESGAVLALEPGWVEGVGGSADGRGWAVGTALSGAPTPLALGNVQVTAVDRAVALTRITDNACGDGQVAVSADGTRVVWVSFCDGDRELWTAASDGSGALQLTVNTADDHSPSLSGDGTRVVFVSDADGDEELWTIATDGTGLAQLTSNTVPDHSPALSADGTRVAYVTGRGRQAELATLLFAAPIPQVLTSDSARDARPRIAADGTRIAWLSWSEGDADVCTIAPDGSGFVRVTLNDWEEGPPDISADGTHVVFASRQPRAPIASDDPSGGPSFAGATRVPPGQRARRARDLFEAAADGSSVVRLTHGDGDEHDPSYAGDGGCVAYVTDDGGEREIELLDLAGGLLVRLTADARPDRAPRTAGTCGRGAWIADDGDGEVWTWDLTATGAFAAGFANTAGTYALPFPDGASPTVATRLRGRHVRVSDLDPRWPEARAEISAVTPTTTADLRVNPSGATEGPTAQVTAYHHANRAHDALASVLTRPPLALPAPLAIDAPLRVRANVPEAVANAFYSPARREASFFVAGGPLRPNTAIDTVILHEYGHFFDDVHGGLFHGSACEAAVALSEGVADAVALLVTGQTTIGQDFHGAGTALRDYASPTWLGIPEVGGQQYDCLGCLASGGKPEPHEHGAAFAGFAWDLRTALGAVLAEDLVLGALSTNPTDMQGAVAAVFVLAASPAFGGTGDPRTSPLNGALCAAAARHGFDCVTFEDRGTRGCAVGVCTAVAQHRSIGTEWLGALVDGESSCEVEPNPDDDGLVFPSAVLSGETKVVTITLSVDPAMLGSGRYGAPPPFPQLAERRLYLNAWIYHSDGAGGIVTTKVLGTASTSPTAGPDNIPGVSAPNTLAFDPETWGGTSLAYPCTIVIPVVPAPRPMVLRVRLDYGEDSGVHASCLSHPTLDGSGCGVARYGEVEDYQSIIMPPP